MIDGNWGPGEYGPLINKTDLSTAGTPYGNPPAIPELLKTIIFAVIYGYFWFRKVPNEDSRTIAFFTTLTVMIFHLWSKGWSPQWSTLIIPFILLTFPGKRGIYLSVFFALLMFIEWPLSEIIGKPILLSLSILLRSATFVGIAYWCTKAIWIRELKTI